MEKKIYFECGRGQKSVDDVKTVDVTYISMGGFYGFEDTTNCPIFLKMISTDLSITRLLDDYR